MPSHRTRTASKRQAGNRVDHAQDAEQQRRYVRTARRVDAERKRDRERNDECGRNQRGVVAGQAEYLRGMLEKIAHAFVPARSRSRACRKYSRYTGSPA